MTIGRGAKHGAETRTSKSHPDFTLERIALLSSDFNFGTDGNERIDEINAAIVPMVVAKQEPMRTGSERPRCARLDSNRAHSRTHLLESWKLTAHEIQMWFPAVHLDDDFVQDLIGVGSPLRRGNSAIAIRIDPREDHRRNLHAGREVNFQNESIQRE
ncbi:MAG: hypothetical protein HY736_04110 [Verrucomicrobia bacterium]|nr:hypothetical protein [Verrucomicrobiota bacterium]